MDLMREYTGLGIVDYEILNKAQPNLKSTSDLIPKTCAAQIIASCTNYL